MSNFKELKYHVMPVDQGQIVEVSYALGAWNGVEYLYQRTYDRNDNTTNYYRSPLNLDSEIEFDPWNNQLPEIDGDWEKYETRFRIFDDGSSDIIEAENMDDAKSIAEEKWQDGSWDTKCLITVYLQEIDWNDEDVGDREEIEVECGDDPPEPDCDEGQEHDWSSPHEVVGGLEENPGVWSTGGTTMVFKTVCSRCGCVKIETDYGVQRNPGACDTVEYDTQNVFALAWAGKIKIPTDDFFQE